MAVEQGRARWLERVRALLAKAEGTDNEAEADTFYAGAQRLMAKHALELADVLAAQGSRGVAERPVVERWVYSQDDRFGPGKATLLMLTAKAVRVETIFHHNRAVRRKPRLQAVSLVGFRADVDFVKALYTSLLLQGLKAASASFDPAAVDASKHVWMSHFLLAYANRVGARLRERHAAEASAAGAGNLPVLYDAVKQTFKEAFPSARTTRSSIRGAAGADAAGVAAGDRASLGGKALRGQAALT